MEIKKINIRSAKLQVNNTINLDSVISRNDKVTIIEVNGQRGYKTNLVGKEQCFIMNEIGNIIWDIIDEPRTVDNIINEILRDFNVKRNECESEVMEFLKVVKEQDIINVNI